MLFSGDESKEFWDLVWKCKNKKDLPQNVFDILYLLGCKLQQLEEQIKKLNEHTK